MTIPDLILMEDDTLDWVNQERVKLGLPELEALPKGERGSTCECPIARSFTTEEKIASSLSIDTVIIDRGQSPDDLNAEGVIQIGHPEHVAEFVRAFDRGAFPHLVAVTTKQEAF